MNNKKNVELDWGCSRHVWQLLQTHFGLPLPEFHVEPLQRYHALVTEWNPLLHLLSANDAAQGIDSHIADAWTLLPYCNRSRAARLLDIGSGGGFPGIPIAIARPHTQVTLLDRSERKTAFLKRAAVQLKLANVSVITGSFPAAVVGSEFDYLTARAVEKPHLLKRGLCEFIARGAVFLCQSQDARDAVDEFHAGPVNDVFDQERLRRGRLWIVRT